MYIKQDYEYKNIDKAKAIKQKRLYKRIFELLNQNNCLFITFTFSDKTLKKTSDITRLRYIKQYLNEQTTEYILNCDYGNENEREHYHAIAKPILKDSIYFNAYKLGQIKATRINQLKRFTKNNKTIEQITNDFLNHAIKESTKDSKIIYSRKPRKTKTNPYEENILLMEQITKAKYLKI